MNCDGEEKNKNCLSSTCNKSKLKKKDRKGIKK